MVGSIVPCPTCSHEFAVENPRAESRLLKATDRLIVPEGPIRGIGRAHASSGRYSSYREVPIFRRQWFFWLLYFTFTPVALAILICGDVYYRKYGAVRSFGLANRIVALVLGLLILTAVIRNYFQ